MSKERYECEYNWIIDNNKRKTKESIIVYDEEWNTLDDICELLNQQDQQISDLEAKLAESEEQNKKLYNEKESAERILRMSSDEQTREIKRLQNELSAKVDYIHELVEVKDDYKQQLAEKEEELKEFKSIGATPRQLQRAYQERYKYNERCDKLKNQHIQNKINFAVSYLEVIKAFIIDKEFYFTGEDYSTVYVEDITEEIDNQIKAIKEKK